MRLLITGKEGQLASSLKELEPRTEGLEIHSIGRPELELCDACSIGRTIDAIKPDIVVNCAAYTAVDLAETEREHAFAVNRDGARNVARSAASRLIPIIHISTDYVFDGSKNTPYREDDATAPACIYGKSKLEGEQAVAAANSRHIILRTAWIYSPFGNNFCKTMLRLAQEGRAFGVVNDQLGNPTYAPHLAEAITAIARHCTATDESARAPWGIYHASASGDATWFDFALEIFNEAKAYGLTDISVKPIPTEDFPTPAKRPSNSRLDCTKLAMTFGVKLHEWQEGVALCVARIMQS